MSNIDTSSWKEFLITDLFELCPTTSKLTKLDLCNTGVIPVYSSETSNNGINGYTDVAAQFSVDEKTPLYLVFGDHTRSMNIADESFCVMDNVKVLKPKYSVSVETLLYISTVWKKAIPNLGYARHWSIAKDLSIKLPVKETEDIDWEYMEKYIKATEKVVIRDVVDWKDEMIKKTKEVVEEVNMLKNKEYVSMSDVINHDQNLKKLEDDIESALKKQGVSIDGKTHLNIQRMTVLVGNYCLDNTSDINCLVEALSKIEQVKFNEDQSHAEIIFKTNSAICKKDGLDTFFAIVFDAADRDEEPSLKYQTKVFKVRIGMNMEYVLMDEVKDLNTILFPGTLKIAGYEL